MQFFKTSLELFFSSIKTSWNDDNITIFSRYKRNNSCHLVHLNDRTRVNKRQWKQQLAKTSKLPEYERNSFFYDFSFPCYFLHPLISWKKKLTTKRDQKDLKRSRKWERQKTRNISFRLSHSWVNLAPAGRAGAGNEKREKRFNFKTTKEKNIRTWI